MLLGKYVLIGHLHHGQHYSIKNYRVVRFSTAVEFMFFRKLMVYLIKYINRFIIKSTLGGAKISFSIILHTKQWIEIHAISNRDSQQSSPVTSDWPELLSDIHWTPLHTLLDQKSDSVILRSKFERFKPEMYVLSSPPARPPDQR